MQKSQSLPSLNKINLLTAIILLSFALARFINLSVSQIEIQLPGFYFQVNINSHILIILIVSGISAAGVDWLLLDHPARNQNFIVEHWLVPALTALVIGIPIMTLPYGTIWWLSFLFGGILLIAVLIGEYIALDPDDVRQPLAAAGLISISFAIYFIFIITLYLSEIRLIIKLPAVAIITFLVCSRTLHLRVLGNWAFLEAGCIAIISTQLSSAFHYWPVSPLSIGLALLGTTYTITLLILKISDGSPLRKAFIEPVILAGILWSSAIWLQ